MKKIFTLVSAALCAMTMAAKDYTGQLSVSVNEAEPTVMNNQSISVEKQADGKYHLSIKNFKFGAISVGTIDVKDMEAISGGEFDQLVYSNPITIEKNEDGSAAMLAGQTMDMNFMGLVSDNVLNMQMNIDAAQMGQVIDVEFQSNGTQIPNSDFEEFHTATVTPAWGGESASSDEPNNWHSFMSASGNPVYVYLAGYAPHTFISEDVRPGSKGKKSVKLLALDMSIAIANGTITTGRMNTGSTTAADTDNNYAWVDMSETDKDANGDPFYVSLVTKPDSIKFWTKFKQGKPNAEHPYATCSAIITDGTRFQEPAPSKTEYKNIVAEARNPKIAETNGEWKEIAIPFEYEKFKDNNVDPKAILVTFSTNADAGQGSDKDEMYLDDVSLVYNHGLKSITYKGEDVKISNSSDDDIDGEGMIHNKGGEEINLNDIVVEADGAGAYITKEGEDWELHVYVTAADLSDSNEYCLSFLNSVKDPTTGIKNATSITLPNGVKAIYNAAGQQVQSMQKGQVYVVKYNNGETKKMIKK